MDRRDFIRLATFTAGALTSASSTTLFADDTVGATIDAGKATESLSEEQLFRLFQEPPNAYRPMVRWWWNGDRVTPQELLRELDVMKSAGIGGVEINPIRFPDDADPIGSQPLIWMSDEWIAALKSVLDGATEREMVCDMIVGSGWPYGGEFLTREEQTQMMALGTRDLNGPARIQLTREELLAEVHPELVSAYKDPLKELVSVCVVPYELTGTDQSETIAFEKGASFEVEIPEGHHVLYFLVKLTGYMAVINGAPGASGPVLNHYNQEAVKRYLNRISDRLIEKLGPLQARLRAFFTDSIELEGANWCDDMFEQFKKRRGYDLKPYLPFVLFKVGEMGNAVSTPYGAKFSLEFKDRTERVRYDFETTKRELFNEHFVATFVDWCRQIGVKSRMQAYGMECDPIAAGMMIDIPECETWIHSETIEAFGSGDYAHGRSYSESNKFVSSAAHLSGKKLISCEEMTNTEDPFHCTMERIKVAGDQSILSGVTQSVLHGFNYSPLEAPFPGWVRYGTFFNERNTWWPYFHLWTMYKARLSALFQMCEMQADIAILPPQADLALKFGFQRDPFPKIVYPQYLFKLWEVVHQNGSGCDYLSEEIIEQSTIESGRLRFNTRSYKAVLMAKVESMRPTTAKKVHKFVEGGGTVIFLDATPHLTDGLKDPTEGNRDVREIMAELRAKFPARSSLVSVQEEDMVDWYRKLQLQFSLTPDVFISEPKDFISQIHYRHAGQEIFFFCHYGPQHRHQFRAAFAGVKGSAFLWNPETGERSLLERDGRDGSLMISLGPSESQLIVFDSSTTTGKPTVDAAHKKQGESVRRTEKISGAWSVRLQHVDGTEKTITLQEPIDLTKREDTKDFAGTIIYSLRFNLSERLPDEMTLGRVRSISEVNLNGKSVGLRWYGEHVYAVRSAVKQGENEISIKVITTLGNYMKSLKTNKVAQDWTSETPTYPIGLLAAPILYSD